MTTAEDFATDDAEAPLADPSVDPDEVEKFSAIAAEWWDPDGKFAPLHRFNPVRLTFLRETICDAFGRDGAARRPLEGLKLLDVGCGGGLVSEPMARLGADVTGLDASAKNIKTASVHADEAGLDIAYRAGTAEQALAEGLGPFDVVLALEIVEHVANVEAFLQTSARLVAPGGLFVMATLNRTSKAFALAVVGAEYVLRWLPRGTHDWRKFVRPVEAARALRAAGLEVGDPIGVSYTPVLDRWRITGDASVNYMLTARRPGGTSRDN